MTEIDELEGEELADAVALKQGWEKVQAVYNELWRKPSGVYPRVQDYRPDRDIAQAWELDGDGWVWYLAEASATLYVQIDKPGPRWKRWSAAVRWDDFPTKAHAYATARCRAYLKAKEDA